MSSSVKDYNCESDAIQRRNDYVRELELHNQNILKLQRYRMLLEKDLQLIDSKIKLQREFALDVEMAIAGYDKFIKDFASPNSTTPKVEVVAHIPDHVMAPNSTSGNNNESLTAKVPQNNHGVVRDVTNRERNLSESHIKTHSHYTMGQNSDEYPLLDLLSSNDNNTKTVGRKAKYILKPEYAGMGIAEAAQIFMSRTPEKKYHVNDLVEALYDGVDDDNFLGVYKSLSTQLSLASKKKGRIKKHSNKGTYYYS